MKYERLSERKTPKILQRPQDGAQRSRNYCQRKRDQGLKEFRAWVTKKEKQQLKDFLAWIREEDVFNSPPGFRLKPLILFDHRAKEKSVFFLDMSDPEDSC